MDLEDIIIRQKPKNVVYNTPKISLVGFNYGSSIRHPGHGSKRSVSYSSTSVSSVNFLITYFDFSYYLLCCPFRVVKNNVSNNQSSMYVIKTNIFQTSACAVLNAFGIYWFLKDMREFPTDFSKNASPSVYFKLLTRICSTSFLLTAMKCFWMDKAKFLNIVNYIAQIESQAILTGKSTNLQSKHFGRFICTSFALMLIYESVWMQIFAPLSTWSESVWNRKLVAFGRYMCFMADAKDSWNDIAPDDLTVIDHMFALIAALIILESYVIGFYHRLVIQFAALTAWSVAYQLAQSLTADMKSSEDMTILPSKMHSVDDPLFIKRTNFTEKNAGFSFVKWSEIYGAYQSIRDLYDMINNTIGSLFSIYLANYLLFNATAMDAAFVTKDMSYQVELIFFILISIVTSIFAADTTNQLNKLKHWLRNDENRMDVPKDQLYIVLSELNARDIGIRGSNVFTITYPLLWNVLSTMVTYFIICLQTRQQQRRHY